MALMSIMNWPRGRAFGFRESNSASCFLQFGVACGGIALERAQRSSIGLFIEADARLAV